MDECFSFPWENSSQGEIVIENPETNLLTSHPNEFQVLDLVSEECPEVEIGSSEQASNQVTGEFVMDQWDGSCVEEVVGSEQDQAQDAEVPLSTDQDEYISSRQFPCDFCSRRFKKEVNLISHMAAHKRAHMIYECAECGMRFDKRSKLSIHQTLHDCPAEPVKKSKFSIVSQAQSFVCELCGVGFAKEKALLSHLRIHEGDSPFACKQCDQAFWDKNSMEEHWKVFHAPIDGSPKSIPKVVQSKFGTYSCITCGISFCRQNDLKRHQLNHEKEEMSNSGLDYLCTVCGETFADTFELLFHTEEMHGDGFEYHCMICGENFIDEDAQLEHVRTEHPESEVLHCKTKDVLRRKPRPRRRRSNLNEEYSNELSQSKSSDQPFACSLCSKKFTTRSSQQIHMRIHTGERPYACRFCHKAFADGGTLRKHERIHTGEKPYACVICPKAFNQRVVLREHIRSHHSSPDPEHSHTTTPYCCAVCSDKFVASQDLMIHLIHHCDTNTAMRRPPRIGPRKYVRRRKLKPYEYEPEEEQSEEEAPQFQSGVTPKYEIVMNTRSNNVRESSPRRSHRRNQDSYATKEYPVLESSPTGSETQSEMETKEEHIENNIPSMKSRAKMIFTEKKRKYIEAPKLEAKRQKREKYTKRMYTEFEVRGSENIKPRTKNTNQHTLTHEKLSMAICPEEESAVDNLLKLCEPFHKENNELLKSCKKGAIKEEQTEEYTDTHDNTNLIEESEKIVTRRSTRRSSRRTKGLSPRNRFLENENEEFETGKRRRTKSDKESIPPELQVKEEFEVCEEQIVYENPDDFVVYETNNADEVNTEAALDSSDPEIQEMIVDQNVPKQQEMIDPLLEFAEISMQHAKSTFKCELCSSVFLERAQLLAHVRVHI